MKAACIQINSGNDVSDNIDRASNLILKSSCVGAEFILLPENVLEMPQNMHNAQNNSSSQRCYNNAFAAIINLAIEYKVWILIGSMAVKSEDVDKKRYNRSFLINSRGEVVKTYDKIHLFDVELKNGDIYSESSIYNRGKDAVIAKTPWGNLGMTICYDLRFPNLFRSLAKNGADFISVPAAFTEHTGRAHWEVLLRARAIENGCYIFAPAQTGICSDGRKTYGHSMIINPWGEILAEIECGDGYIIADIDVKKVIEARALIPSLSYESDFS